MANALIYFQFFFFGLIHPVDLPYTQIENSFESNNSEFIISNCEEVVLLDLDGDEGIYNHSQATMVWNDCCNDDPKGEVE